MGNTAITEALNRELSDEEKSELINSFKQDEGQRSGGDYELEWEIPIPFDNVQTPPFPIEALPKALADYVSSLSESTQTPPEMASVLILGVLATIMQGRYIVKINSDWHETLSLYTVAIAAPGEKKSAVISHVVAPIAQYEKYFNERNKNIIVQNQSQKVTLEKKFHVIQDKVAKDKADMEEANDAATELANFKQVHPLRLIADDATPEKLINLMSKQGGRISISSSEGGLFDTLCGRYEKNFNIDIYLKAYSGDLLMVDRIGRAPDHIENPALSMILTVQPEVLSGLMGNAVFKGRGLLGRFTYAICNSKIGSRNVNPPSIPLEVKEEYYSLITDLLEREIGGDITNDTNKDTLAEITLSPEADKLRLSYAEMVEKRLINEWDAMRDWGNKAIGMMLRIAGLLHGVIELENPTTNHISGETISNAIKIMECLGKHAEAAYQTMGADSQYNEARYVLKRLKGTCNTEITKRDLFQQCRGHYNKVDEIEPALITLSDMGYIHEVEKKIDGKGRPSKIIYLNPYAQNTQNTQK